MIKKNPSTWINTTLKSFFSFQNEFKSIMNAMNEMNE